MVYKGSSSHGTLGREGVIVETISSAMRKCFYRSLHSNRTVFRSLEVCAAFAPRSTLLISGCGRVLDLTMISSAGVIAAVV